MRLAIFEPSWEGHHMAGHVRHIAVRALERGWKVDLVTTPSAARSEAYEMVQRNTHQRMGCYLAGEARSVHTRRYALLAMNQLRKYIWMHQAYFDFVRTREVPDVIYVVNLDHCDKVMSVMGTPFGSTSFLGMLMSAKFHMRQCGLIAPSGPLQTLDAQSYRRLMRIPQLKKILTIDEVLPIYLREQGWPLRHKVEYVPDIGSVDGVLSREVCRCRLDIKDEDVVVLLYGELSARKGVAELLRAVADPSCANHVRVILGGLMDKDTHDLVRGPVGISLARQGRLKCLEGFLTEGDEYLLFRAADIAWLGYRGFYGMSGVLVQAARMGLPILSSAEGLIGYLTEKYSLGLVFSVGDPSAIATAINRLASCAGLRAACGLRGYEFGRSHTPAGFGKAICDAIEGTREMAPGIATAPGRATNSRSWQQ